MSGQKFEVQPLFATPLVRADVSDAITQDQIEYVQSLKMIKNVNNLISEDLYIFEHPQLAGFKKAIAEVLNRYATDVLGITQELVVTQSWALSNPPGVGMHSHSHSNSLVSGSFYYAPLPDPVSRVFFDRHTAYQRIQLLPSNEKRNIFNTAINVIEPKEGEVLLFPSEINHMIEANGAPVERKAIAFNAFVKGTIGDYRDVSQLTV